MASIPNPFANGSPFGFDHAPGIGASTVPVMTQQLPAQVMLPLLRVLTSLDSGWKVVA